MFIWQIDLLEFINSPVDLVFLKKDSWRDKDKLDVLAMNEIIAREEKQNERKEKA